jgi:hypothetical protein
LKLASHLGLSSVQGIPISALEGDNVVERSERMRWYTGPTLLEHLEIVPIGRYSEMDALRFPVQSVIRPDASFRGFAGRIASGTVQPGDAVLALPSGQRTQVESIVSFDGELEAAQASQSVVLKLADEIDLSRGDMLVTPDDPPHESRHFLAMVVWLHATPLQLQRVYLAKHVGKYVKAKATAIRFQVNVNTLAEHPARHLEMNGIAAVELETSEPLFFDCYARNRTTGSLILIDPLTNATVGAVMIRENLSNLPAERIEHEDIPGASGKVTLDERIQRRGHRPAIFTVDGDRIRAEAVERVLIERGFESVLINYSEVPPSSRRILFNTLWSLGLVIVSWQETGIRARDRALFASIAGKFHFALSSTESLDDRQNELSRAVKFAETLRTIHEPEKKGGAR